jgi:hypothetical protein
VPTAARAGQRSCPAGRNHGRVRRRRRAPGGRIRIAGKCGGAWIELSGELTIYDLPPGQTLLVHPGHVGMFQGSVQFQITRMRGIANALFGGDGFHLVALTGPGRIWLQSMPIAVLAHSLSAYLGGESTAKAEAPAPSAASSAT